MRDADVYLHIGYHRTGTTFLQSCVFPALADHANLAIKPDIGDVLGDDEFDPTRFARDLGRPGDHDKTILSHEVLSGLPEGGRPEVRFRTAERLHAAFPNGKVIVVVRNQFDYLLSVYAYRVLLRGMESRSLPAYLADRYDMLSESLQYDRLIRRYVELFGKDRVLCLLYEEMAADRRSFVSRMLEFMGLPEVEFDDRRVNESTRSRWVVDINRALNLPLDRTLGALRRGKAISHQRYLDLARPYFRLKDKAVNPALRRLAARDRSRLELGEEWRARLTPVLRESNRRLASLIGADLTTYRYVQ